MGCCVCTQQATASSVEVCGNFDRVIYSGFSCIGCFPISQVPHTVSLRLQRLTLQCSSKTKNDVFVKCDVAVQYEVLQDEIFKALYVTADVKQNIQCIIYDKLTTLIPTMDLDELFINHRVLIQEVARFANESIKEMGYQVKSVLITRIEPDKTVSKSMSNINRARRQRAAKYERAEMNKALAIKDAEAKMIAKKLQGEGVARQRQVLIEGLRNSVTEFGDKTINAKRVMQLLLVSQYLETLKQMCGTKETKCVFYVEGANDSVTNMDDLRSILIQGSR